MVEKKAEKAVQPEEAPAVAGRILMVDDEEVNLRLLQAVLHPAGHEIFVATTGEEALEKANDLSPDLILLDVMMPGMDGYEVLRRLRETDRGRDIPVIMVTSLDDFVTKPISVPVLTARVGSLLKVKAYHDSLRDQREFLEREVSRKTDKLKRYTANLEILNQAGAMIHSVLDVPSILRSVAQAALELWESDGATAGIVEGGKLLFSDWYWKKQHRSEPFRCDILDEIRSIPHFMDYLNCRERLEGPCGPTGMAGIEISECLAVPIHSRNLEIQGCLLLLNPVKDLAGGTIIENPLPGLISSAATALENARNLTELRKKEEELKLSLDEKDLLLKEIHHRVKNNLQAIVGLMEAHLGTVQDPKDRQVFLKGQSLALSISMIHELLYKTGDYAKVDFVRYIDQLVSSSSNLYPDVRERVTIDVKLDDIFLNTDTAVPVSLIINELVSNSLIHAFPGQLEGRISITLEQEDDGWLELNVVDNGIGMDDVDEDPEKQALGLSLVRSLTENLNGTMEISTNGGVGVMIRFREYYECENLELG